MIKHIIFRSLLVWLLSTAVPVLADDVRALQLTSNIVNQMTAVDQQRQQLVAALVAVYFDEGHLDGAAAANAEQLAKRLLTHDGQYHLALVLNFPSLQQRLFNSSVADWSALAEKLGNYNPESRYFFRLNYAGQLLPWQNRNFNSLPWSCVDDLRVNRPVYRQQGYAIRLWHEVEMSGELPTEQLFKRLEQLNQDNRCGVNSWALPTQGELHELLNEKNKLQFPQTFPGWLQHQPEFFWVNGDSSRKTLQPVIYAWQQQQLMPEKQSAALLAKSWQPAASERLQTPQPLTRVEKQRLIKQLRQQYQSPTPADWPAPQVDNGVDWQPLGLLPQLPKLDQSEKALVELGKRLFFDGRLSQSRTISCASCHSPNQGWDDNRATAIGHAAQEGNRNTPGLLNIGMQNAFFWDGRAATLEEQALGPIENPIEMNLSLEHLQQRINNGELDDYRDASEAIFAVTRLSPETIAQALAAYQRRIRAYDNRFDRFLKQEVRFSDSELWGLHLFRTKARCMNCHSGPNFTQGSFENLGLADMDFAQSDLGLYNVSGLEQDVGKFRTPTLRGVMHTAPYMHNGRFKLDETLISYNNAMGVRNISIKLKIAERRHDPMFQPGSEKLHVLNLAADELKALKSFIKALSAEEVPQQ